MNALEVSQSYLNNNSASSQISGEGFAGRNGILIKELLLRTSERCCEDKAFEGVQHTKYVNFQETLAGEGDIIHSSDN